MKNLRNMLSPYPVEFAFRSYSSAKLSCFANVFGLSESQISTTTEPFMLQAGGRSLQDDFSVHGNAELNTSRASCYPVSGKYSGRASSMFSGCNGYHGPHSRVFLGQWPKDQGPAPPHCSLFWVHGQGFMMPCW